MRSGTCIALAACLLSASDIAPFKQDLTDYFFNRGAGHFRLNVTEGRVDLEYYPGAALAPARTFRLKCTT